MRYSALSSLEGSLLQNSSQEYQFKKIAVPVKGEDLTLEGLLCIPSNRSGYYYPTVHPKKRIVLHFTAGHIRSDLSALTRNDYHVSVPFVIGRNGTIYQLFSSKYWSGHIGKGIGNTNTGNAQDKITIGIELSNYGFLTERDGQLETYYSRMKDANGRIAPVDVYCSLSEQQAYEKIVSPFRGQQYYASYTDEQYNSLIILLRYLTAQYDIPRQFLPETTRYKAFNEVLNFSGIVSHINYRVDGKWDIGPAFDWNKVINGVQAVSFQPAKPRAASETKAAKKDIITSEEQLDRLLPKTRESFNEDAPYEELNRELKDDGELDIRSAAKKKKNLYALIVGINGYEGNIVLEGKVGFPRLHGCVEDAKKMKAYLEKDASFDAHIEMLTDKKATKKDIAKMFVDHLGKAKKGDTALFYYSGHGTQQWAEQKAWTYDTDGKLECFACYYTSAEDDFLMSDKEMRYLIHKVAANEPHIVTVFDCCHSADITRNGRYARTAFTSAIEKSIPYVFKKRDWKQFIFSEEISLQQVNKDGESKWFPEGTHIQLSACESDESAVEVAGEGVFTKSLIEVLRITGGDITYHALRNRVRQYLRNTYEQKPRIYVANGNDDMLFQNFLGRPSGKGKQAFGEVLFNVTSGWLLNLGAIHGIGEKMSSIRIMDEASPGTSFTAKLGSIGTDYTQLIPSVKLDTTKVYTAHIEGLLSQDLQVNIKNTDGFPEDHAQLVNAIFDEANKNIIAEDNEQEAQYVVQSKYGKFFITKPNDEFRPLALPFEMGNEQSPMLIASQLQHISKWEYVRNFVNQDPGFTLSGSALKIECFGINSNGDSKQLTANNGRIDIPYELVNNKWRSSIKVKLTNTTTVNLYCCAIYLSSDFGSSLRFLNPNVYMLEPGNSVELTYAGKPVIPVTLDEVTRWYNASQQIEHLKFIASTEEFDAQAMVMEGLPRPATPKSKTRGGIKKGLGEEEVMEEQDMHGWVTQLVTLVMRNPEYNMIREADLKLMLNDENVSPFALGLFFDGYVDEQMQPAYKLKPSVKILTEAGELQQKGIIQDKVIDVANWWARHRRNNHYKEMIKRFPSRVRIVSEGDSWFQHPLVLDIIDHLSRVYAIYCVAAAGDTLRNYLSNKKHNGEYFLDAIDEQQPAIFLISGGGNDILGSQFRSYLVDKPNNDKPEGEDPRRFLKDSLFNELDALMEIYRSLFGLLKKSKPNLHIVVHGYDYPVKLNDANKGWLGRYMIEKGINREGDRKAIIRLIMDTFNEKLSAITKGFDTVTYIDARNTVRYDTADGVDQWYDEIHPNNDGFQQVAMKFIQVINSIAPPPTILPPGFSAPPEEGRPITPVERAGSPVTNGGTTRTRSKQVTRGAKKGEYNVDRNLGSTGGGASNGGFTGGRGTSGNYDIGGETGSIIPGDRSAGSEDYEAGGGSAGAIIPEDTGIDSDDGGSIYKSRSAGSPGGGVYKTRSSRPAALGSGSSRAMPSAPLSVPMEETAPIPQMESSAPPAPVTSPGQLDYDIPGNMNVGQTYTCKVNIADINVDAEKVKTGASSEHLEVRIAEEMSVKLMDVSGGTSFKILSVNSERQAILPGEVTNWIFKVSPIEAGKHSLLLKVTVHFGDKNKDLQVLEKEIMVSTSSNGTLSTVTDIRRILFLCANPEDTDRLKIGAESRKIKEELLMGGKRDNILFTMDTAVTPRTMIRSILREKPSILHFSGHGDEDGICLEQENGLSISINADALDTLFSTVHDTVQCVILNACYSIHQAEAIKKHVPYVIGMKQAIRDELALSFAVGFYQALSEGEDIEDAFNVGKASLMMERGADDEDASIPELLK